MTDEENQSNKTTPDNFILEKDETYVVLDDIHNNLITLVEIEVKNQEILLESQKIQKRILQELKAEADDGEVLRLSGTITTTAFTIVNTITDPGHPIKAFEFTNDGNNSVYVGFNVVISGEGADIIDVANTISRFDLVGIGEDLIYKYNRHKIRNIYMLASGGNSTYRLKLIW